MNNHDIIKTACLIFGFYFIVLALGNTRELITYGSALIFLDYGHGDLLTGDIFAATQLVVNLIIGILIIKNSDAITKKLVDIKSGSLQLKIKKIDLIELTIIAISISAIVSSIPELLHKTVYYVYFEERDEVGKAIFEEGRQKALIFYSVFKLAVGLILILNARNFAKKINRIGVKDDAHEKEINAL